MNQKKILFLAANPQETARLQLDQEFNKIDEGLRRSQLRDQFELVSRWAVDPTTLRRALLEEQPYIVHFSGHGEGQAGLTLVGQDGKPSPATSAALAGLFEIGTIAQSVRCVLLNACYAEAQGNAIVQHIEYVIGMRQAVRDDAAIAFATGFYDGLGYGLSIEDAFKLGRNAIQFELSSFSGKTRQLIPVNLATQEAEPLDDHLIPVLLKRQTMQNAPTEAEPLSEKLRTAETQSQLEAREQYQARIKAALSGRVITPIEEFQLAAFAKVLGLSEAEANQLLTAELDRIEQAKQDYGRVLQQTLEQGFNPLDAQIQTQLKELQNQLDLLDAEVETISTSIFAALAISHFEKGKALYDQGDLAEAIDAYQQAIQLDPNDASAHFNLGLALHDQGDLAEAIDAYQQAIQLDPNDASAYDNLGVALYDQGDLAEAIDAYQQAIQLNPNDASTYDNLGLALYDQGDLAEAIDAYQQAIQLDPNYTNAHHNLEIALKAQRESKDTGN